MSAPKSRAQICAEKIQESTSDIISFAEIQELLEAIEKDTQEREAWKGPLYAVQGMIRDAQGGFDGSLSGQRLFKGPCYIVPAEPKKDEP